MRRGLAAVEAQTATVLTLYAVLVLVHVRLGGRGFFLDHVAPGASALAEWAWWFGLKGVLGFGIPVLVLVWVFRQRPTAIGLSLGDWRFALTVFAVYLPLVVIGTWILSDQAPFQAEYPHLREAAESWRVFGAYHGWFLLYWLGWEYLWRGFVLFGTARTLGVHAIFVQAIPFAMLHLSKPVPELALSVVGAILLGALVWRCRSFWIAVPIHAAQMLALDFWCSMRVRTGVDGIGPEALLQLITG